MSGQQWERLQPDYHLDDRVTELRLQFGYLAEAMFTRFIAYGEPVRCAAPREFDVLARTLGFDSSEVPDVAQIATEARRIGLFTRARISHKSAPRVAWDLTNRAKYKSPKSATPGYEAEKKRRQRAQFADSDDGDTVPGQKGTMSRSTNERTNERDVQKDLPPSLPTEGIPPEAEHLFTKYLGKLKADSPRVFGSVEVAELAEIATDEGMELLRASRILSDVWDWWRTAPPSKRWKKATRGWRNWLRREAARIAEQASATNGSAPATVPRRPPPEPEPDTTKAATPEERAEILAAFRQRRQDAAKASAR